MIRRTVMVLAILWSSALPMTGWAASASCGKEIGVQILGSGGPEGLHGRASSGYLVWINGRARVLVDFGGGTFLRFGESGADMNDLAVILLTHLHADHTSDLPALLKRGYFSERRAPLPLFGPTGNARFPGTRAFMRTLFDSKSGSWRYLGGYLSGGGRDFFSIPVTEISADLKRSSVLTIWKDEGITIRAAPVEHGSIPAVAWRIEIKGRAVVFTGDTSGSGGLLSVAKGADLLVAHLAIPEDAPRGVRSLHMVPSVIGKIAKTSGAKRLLLSHIMDRTEGKREESIALIRKAYAGPVDWGSDLMCIGL